MPQRLGVGWPQRLGAGNSMKLYEYFVTQCVYERLEETLDEFAKEFWRLHTMTMIATAGGTYTIVFERELPNPNIFYGQPLSERTMEELKGEVQRKLHDLQR